MTWLFAMVISVFNPEVMLATVIVLIVLVQVIQFLGNMLAKKLNKKIILFMC